MCVLILGEAPSAKQPHEVLRGRAGDQLFGVLGSWGFPRSSFELTNLVSHPLPDNRDPFPEEIETDRLVQEIGRVGPELVVALGRLAAEWCLGRPVIMGDDYGLVYPWSGPGLSLGRLPAVLNQPPAVLVSYHPAAVLHSPVTYTLFWHGLRRLKGWLEGDKSLHEDPMPSPIYQNAPQRPQDALYGHREGPIGVDTEGDLESPLGASWSRLRGTGEWAHVGYGGFHMGHVVLHNALYDIPMLRQMGYSWERLDDTMLMAHVLGEPKVGLKWLAARHCGMTLPDYEDMIAPAQMRIAQDYLGRLLNTYTPKYQERISEKTGKPLKPKLLAPSPMYRAVARCLQKANPYTAWQKQSEKIRHEAEQLIGPMREATLEDV